MSKKPFFFLEHTITGTIYLDRLKQFAFPQVEQIELENNVRKPWQQDCVPSYFPIQVHNPLDEGSLTNGLVELFVCFGF